MQQFRPPEVIAADTRLAEALHDDDVGALRELVVRYGRAVTSVVGSTDRAAGPEAPVDVFERCWNTRRDLHVGDDPGLWVASHAVGSDDPDSVGEAVVPPGEQRWLTAMAVDAVDPGVRDRLRSHHVDGAELADDLDRHELRLRRRLSQLGDDDAVDAALGDSGAWIEPPADLAELVIRRVEQRAATEDQGVATVDDASGEEDATVGDPRPDGGRVTRSLRPVLLGLAGAVVVLFVAIIALSAASGSPDPVVLTVDLVPTGEIVEVEAGELVATERDSGTELALSAPTLPERSGDLFYEGEIVLRSGEELAVGTFTLGFDVRLWSSFPVERIETFRVVARELGTESDDVVLRARIPQRG